MTTSAVADRDFTGLTIRDQRGGHLTIERTNDGRLSAWIAPPGSNDGYSVTITDDDRQQLATFLNCGPDLATQLDAYREMADELRERNEKLTAVAAAAAEWRAQFNKPADTKPPRMAALIAAVDALPNMQEPCDICSGYGCPDCRDILDAAEVSA